MALPLHEQFCASKSMSSMGFTRFKDWSLEISCLLWSKWKEPFADKGSIVERRARWIPPEDPHRICAEIDMIEFRFNARARWLCCISFFGSTWWVFEFPFVLHPSLATRGENRYNNCWICPIWRLFFLSLLLSPRTRKKASLLLLFGSRTFLLINTPFRVLGFKDTTTFHAIIISFPSSASLPTTISNLT